MVEEDKKTDQEQVKKESEEVNPALPKPSPCAAGELGKTRKSSIAKKSEGILPLPKNTHKLSDERKGGVKPQVEKVAPEKKGEQEQKPKEEKPQPQEKTHPEVPHEEKKEAETKKKKKINRLTLKELEKKLQQVQEKMGNLDSSYAQQLLKRKEQLLGRDKTEKDLETGGNNEQ